MSNNPVVHFEMPAKDKKRVMDFYTQAFNWKMIPLGENMGNYVMAHTAETDEHNMVKTPGTINGGFFDYKNDELNSIPHLVIAVDNLEASVAAITKAGGKIIGTPMDIPGIGRYVSFRDSEDNLVGILQAHAQS